MSTDNSDSDRTTIENETTIFGGGTVTYEIDANHRRANSLASKIDTTIEAFSARAAGNANARGPGPKRADTEYKLAPIKEAIADGNDSASFAKNIEGELEYVVEEAYYPGEYSHYVDVTGIPVDERHRAFLTAQSALCQRGYIINSLRADDDGRLEKLHIVSQRWVHDSRSFGRKEHEDGDRHADD